MEQGGYACSNMITEQISRGRSYSELKPVKSIIVADFDFFPESEKCHTIFQMLEKDEHFPFNDLEDRWSLQGVSNKYWICFGRVFSERSGEVIV